MRIPGLTIRVDDSAVPWRSTRHAGVHWLPLESLEGAQAEPRYAEVLIRMDPGCAYPAHLHVGGEEVLILQGGYEDELGTHGPGTFLRYAPGSRHAPRACGDPSRPTGPDNPACILFAIVRDGVENLE